ncbi:hypothetical protein SAMN04488042_102312 [Shimia aestuarii]|uniref:Flp pilus assembly protein TadG n=1 Tax=Shimia aestuarii TaxID=254406 RepID=A0A1I4M0J3_9RHOB|nr:hypothetical protein SAMN04488042_102312 [Shimia aestuarii]
MMPFSHMKSFLDRFRKDTSGTVAVETVILVPILFWAFLATIMFFDLYKSRSAADKAAFTISDMLSRETVAINQTYLDNTLDLFNNLARSDGPTSLRVSVFTYSKKGNKYRLDWSHASGGAQTLSNTDLPTYVPNIPTLLSGERLILVETFGRYDSPIDIGIGALDINTFVFTRPRFAPLLAWERV